MDARVKHLVACVEDLGGPVAVMDVPIQDQDPFRPALRDRVRGADRSVVAKAETHRPVGLGVMSRRPVATEGESVLAGKQPLGALGRRPGAAQRRLPRGSHSDRVSVDGSAALGAEALEASDVAGVMDALEPLPLRLWRCQLLETRPSSGLQFALDRADPLGVLGVRTRLMLERGGMPEVEAHRVWVPYPPTLPATPPAALPACDVAVVGGGAAGLHVALEASALGARVTVISRKPLTESASFRAQGGLAAAIDADDSPELHAEDTFNAGRGLCVPAAVEALTREAPAAVEALMSRGRLDLGSDGELALGLEGGRSARRIVHAGGAETGRALTSRLATLAAADPGIEVLEGASVTALWSDGTRCGGVITDRGTLPAASTVIATGGGAALWKRTTNPRGAIAAGAVLAHAAGADLADLELCQFHPTALALPGRDTSMGG